MKISMKMIDPELRNCGRLMNFFNRTFTEKRLHLLNKLLKKYPPKVKVKSITFEKIWIPRKDGSKMRICIFKPITNIGNAPGMLWFHGGGYAIGAPEQAQKRAQEFIERRNCIIIAPEYQLSVQAPYPAALDDCYDTLVWMKNNAEKLGIRDDQLMVGGESAGGGLAVALCLYARDKGEVKIAFQLPLYPMIDDRMVNESSINNNAPVWNSISNYNGWKLYLKHLFGTPNVPAYAAPARAENYRNLPPAATFVGGLEPFRDETINYIENLKKAGVPVDYKIFEGCFHGFDVICPKAKISQEAISFTLKSFEFAVDNYFSQQDY